MNFLHGHQLLIFLLSTLPGLPQAAPQKRDCHMSSESSSYDYYSPRAPLSTSYPGFSPTSTTPFIVTDTTVYPVDTNVIPTSIPSKSIPSVITTPSTITPEVIVIYPSQTYTLTTDLSFNVTLTTPHAVQSATPSLSITNVVRSSSFNTSFVLNMTTPTASTRTFTTPDIGAMQTAYFISVCGWEQHAQDAICLGGNTMMCCRADNEHCQAILSDGGLSCEGIQSGEWATTWTRPTVTVTPGESIASVTATATTLFGAAVSITESEIPAPSSSIAITGALATASATTSFTKFSRTGNAQVAATAVGSSTLPSSSSSNTNSSPSTPTTTNTATAPSGTIRIIPVDDDIILISIPTTT